jgi:hypothetical protein
MEKRRESRSAQRYPVTIRALPAGAAQAAETLDVSAQGASLRAPFSLPVGGLVRVAIRATEGGAAAGLHRSPASIAGRRSPALGTATAGAKCTGCASRRLPDPGPRAVLPPGV